MDRLKAELEANRDAVVQRKAMQVRYRAPTELVQHFTYRGRLRWRKGAASHIIDMVWLCRSPLPVGRKGVFYLFIRILPALAALRERGEERQYLCYLRGARRKEFNCLRLP